MGRIAFAILGLMGTVVSAQSPIVYQTDMNRPISQSLMNNMSTVPTVPMPTLAYQPISTSQPVTGVHSESGCSSCGHASNLEMCGNRCGRRWFHRPAFDRIRSWFGYSSHVPCIQGNCTAFTQPSAVYIPQPTRTCGLSGGVPTCGWLSGPCGARSYMSREMSLFSKICSTFGCKSCGGCGCNKCQHTKGPMPNGHPYLGSFQVTQSVGTANALQSPNAAPVVHRFADPYHAGTGSILYPGIPTPKTQEPKPMPIPMKSQLPGTTYPTYGGTPITQSSYTNR